MKGMNAIVEKWATFESNNKKLYTKKKSSFSTFNFEWHI